MQCDPYEILSKVVRIASCTALDTPQRFKGILRFLRKSFLLEDASFLLLDTRQKNFSEIITASGREYFRPFRQPLGKTPEGQTLNSGQPIFQQDRSLLPVLTGRRRLGVLILRTPPANPLHPPLSALFRTVCAQLASLAQEVLTDVEERRQVAEFKLLSALGRELTHARTAVELLNAASQTILGHSEAACVILRPLYGGTVLGRDHLAIRPKYREWRPLFLDWEEKESTRAVDEGRSVFLQDLSPKMELTGPFPATVVVVPLLYQDRVLGFLTLFGGPEEGEIPLVDDSGIRRFFMDVGSQIAQALERVTALEQLGALSEENDRKLRETSILYRISRMMHSTLRLNELMHIILSAATVPAGGGFERAMLFMINERSGVLQGMLGVTRETSALVLPLREDPLAWEHPVVNPQVQEAQRQALFCQRVLKQRLPLEAEENALARAALQERVVFVSQPGDEPSSGAALAKELQLGPHACAPLMGRERPLGVLVVANPGTEEITSDLLRFLELFANQAGTAMENSMLLHRLETAHRELRETQERLIQGEKMAVLGEMSASITHELKNPLVSIGGFAQRLFRTAPPGSKDHEYAAVIAREVRRLEEMLSNILTFSKKSMLCLTECSLPDIIEEALYLEADALDAASIELKKDIAADLPPITGDEQKLRQVLINLIANARQAMKAGGVLTLRAYRGTLRGDEAGAVEVEDTGGGIPADVLRNIFNPFFTTKGKGTGLGLSISHRIVEHHHGEIEVQNRENGAVFILRLPVHGGPVPFR